jgi:outer membrane protein assembly factor BamB
MRLLVCLAIVSRMECSAFQQWPQFRGANSGGVAEETASPPVEFGPARRLLWKRPLPAGHSSPVVWNGRVFVTGFDAATKALELICVSAKTGAILWKRAAEAPQIEATHVVSNPATASPALDAERVYAYFSSYGLMAFRHTGEPSWTLPLPMPVTHHGSGASPILIGGDLLILNHDAMREGYLLAVNRSTGKEVWKQAYPSQAGRVESYSTPLLFQDQLVLHRAGVVEAYEAATGQKRWSIPASTSGASTAVGSKDLIYVDTWNTLGEGDQRPALPDYAALLKSYDKDANGSIAEAEFPTDLRYTARPELEAVPRSQNFVSLRQLDRNKDGAVDEAEWEAFRTRIASNVEDHGLLAIRVTGEEAAVVWREKTAIPEVPSPLLYAGRLFLVRNGGIATCLDPVSGKVLYRGRVGSPGAYFASPVGAAGRVYLASSDGVVTVLDAGKDRLEVLARNDLGEGIVATPAIAGRVIYVRALQTLFAFSEP